MSALTFPDAPLSEAEFRRNPVLRRQAGICPRRGRGLDVEAAVTASGEPAAYEHCPSCGWLEWSDGD